MRKLKIEKSENYSLSIEYTEYIQVIFRKSMDLLIINIIIIIIIIIIVAYIGSIQPRVVYPLPNAKYVYLLPYLLPCFCFS